MNELISRQKVLIIDGSSFLYRAFYAIKPMMTTDGKSVQAVYGFCRMIKKLIDTHKPTHAVIAWDSEGKTARHDLYPEYKAHRDAPPRDLFEQKKIIKEFADTIQMSQVAIVGFEADDIINTIALQAQEQGFDVVIVTSDKDMRQIVSTGCTIFDPFLDRILDIAAIELIYSFTIDRLPLYFSLLGDASDNIPGVKGIGKVGATKLATQFSSLDDLYANIEQIGGKSQTYLQSARDNAYISYQLFLLDIVPGEFAVQRYVFLAAKWNNAYQFFKNLQFASLLKGMQEQSTISVTHSGGQTSIFAPDVHIDQMSEVRGALICVQSIDQLVEIEKNIQLKKCVAIDTETTGVDVRRSTLVGISIACDDDVAYYIPCAHESGELQLPLPTVIAWLQKLTGDESIQWCFHNAKFDLHILAYAGIAFKNCFFDTMIAAHLLLDDDQGVGLKALSERLLKQRMKSFSDITSEHGCASFAQVPINAATVYAAADALQTWRLVEIFKKQLLEKNLDTLFYTIEMPLIPVLVALEHVGMMLDKQSLVGIAKRLAGEVERIRQEIVALLGPQYCQLNLNSPKQLQAILFGDLGLKSVKKTAKGTSRSTDQQSLQELVDQHPVIRLIMRYRELYKLFSTYGEGLQQYYDEATGKVYTSMSQIRTATGRLSSSDPNMQNIPIADDAGGVAIRSAFIVPAGYVCISADYSQIELRVLAQLSGDSRLVDAFINNQDIHAITAAGLFDVPVDAVTREQRQIAKKINFSILYGLSAFRLAKDLDIPYKQAQEYHDRFWKQYPGVVLWMQQVIEGVRQKGFVQTLGGRRRSIPGIYEANKALFNAASRIAINTPCQGTAAEVIKKGMIALYEQFLQKKLPIQIVLQIHDELIFVVPIDSAQEVEAMIKYALENIEPDWSIPLQVTTRIGSTWDEVSK